MYARAQFIADFTIITPTFGNNNNDNKTRNLIKNEWQEK